MWLLGAICYPLPMSQTKLGVWALAFGYFACYVPFSALTKALSEGKLEGMNSPLNGFELLPVSAMTSLVTTLIFLTFMGWWRYSGRRSFGRFSIPFPSIWTCLSGACSSAIIVTTTLSYTFKGVSIVFVMLLMRGGVLCIAPMVDMMSGRLVRWFSWAGFAFSLVALFVAFAEKGGYAISVTCAVCVVIYLASYFVRLKLMSKLAKSSQEDANRRYFVEEQLVATPLVVFGLFAYALWGNTDIASDLMFGYTQIWSNPILPQVLLVGLLSQGIGIFGVLLLLDKSENTFCVPINRSSSILAGVVASVGLSVLYGSAMPSAHNLVGALLIVVAILFLTLPPMLQKRRALLSKSAAA
jgi:hypothetical protein